MPDSVGLRICVFNNLQERLVLLTQGLHFKNHCTPPDSFVASYQFHAPTHPNVSYDLSQPHLHDLQLYRVWFVILDNRIQWFLHHTCYHVLFPAFCQAQRDKITYYSRPSWAIEGEKWVDNKLSYYSKSSHNLFHSTPLCYNIDEMPRNLTLIYIN